MKTQIHIRKESLKFSSAHMTVFPDGTKEALHGHNYQVALGVELKATSFEKMIPFADFKKVLKSLCEAWDEKVLLATGNPYYEEVKKDKKEIEFKVCKKRYVLPLDEVQLLAIDNISSEALAEHFLELFLKTFGEKSLKKWATGLSIRIEESPGQGASAAWSA
ncbi:hypothetical protein EBR03_06510 [bacterium]|nr:hypothetical protein [bacterium]